MCFRHSIGWIGISGTITMGKIKQINLENPRLVNHFKIGCDPEYVMTSRLGIVQRADIYMAGGFEGLFGTDGAGTQIELRPRPSKFAVEVVGSLLQAMRLMSANIPEIASYDWMTGGYINGVSLGGHLHFGRKVKDKYDQEIDALDTVAGRLEVIGGAPGQRERRNNARDYGRWGDVRQQRHGYEYRSTASFLHSPAWAHLVLTLGKLAVQTPDRFIGANCSVPINTNNAAPIYTNELSKLLDDSVGLDDDAALAKITFEAFKDRKISLMEPDFKLKWGIPTRSVYDIPNIHGFSYQQHINTRLIPIPYDKSLSEDVVAAIKTGITPPWRQMALEIDLVPYNNRVFKVNSSSYNRGDLYSRTDCEIQFGRAYLSEIKISQTLLNKLPTSKVNTLFNILKRNCSKLYVFPSRIGYSLHINGSHIPSLVNGIIETDCLPLFSGKTLNHDKLNRWDRILES